jgi:hypothetical protein
MPVIMATREAEIGRSDSKPALDKQFLRLYLENTQHKKRLMKWLKW